MVTLLFSWTIVYAADVLGWKPGRSSKFRPILATQETLTDIHGDETKKIELKKHFALGHRVFLTPIFFLL